jgi:hypothetical protein
LAFFTVDRLVRRRRKLQGRGFAGGQRDASRRRAPAPQEPFCESYELGLSTSLRSAQGLYRRFFATAPTMATGRAIPGRLYPFTTIALQNVGSTSWFREGTIEPSSRRGNAAGWSTSAAGNREAGSIELKVPESWTRR